MPDHEQIVEAVEAALAGVTGNKSVLRNSAIQVVADMCPCTRLFEKPDEVIDRTRRRNMPQHKRTLAFGVGCYVAGATDASASQELWAFVKLVRKAIWGDPEDPRAGTLGGLCGLRETGTSDVLAKAGGANIRAVAVAFEADYVEDLNKV